ANRGRLVGFLLDTASPGIAFYSGSPENAESRRPVLRLSGLAAGTIVSARKVAGAYAQKITDADFFGVWDAAASRWKTEGKIDYGYSPALAEVERCSRAGDYSQAKVALLDYMRHRENV